MLIFVNAHKGGSSSAAAGYPYPYYYPSYPAAAPVAPVAAAYPVAFADPLAGIVAPEPAYGAAGYPYYGKLNWCNVNA